MGTPVWMDAITMLKNDHKAVEQLFKRFERAGDGAVAEKRRVVDDIIEALSVHAAIEEQLFYPVARATVPGTDDVVLESLEEHHVVKWMLAELERTSADDERFDAKVTVLIENVRHHVEEEEGEFFPRVRDELGRGALAELGDTMATARGMAPTHPHPRSPDTPPANLVVGAAAGAADRITDTVTGFTEGSAAAVKDVVARVLGRRSGRRRAVTGSKTTRRAASHVRDAASDATEAVIDATRRAQRDGRKATAPATKRAKGSASKARTSTKRATSSAKRTAKRSTKRASGAAKRTRTTRTAKKRAGSSR